MSNELSPMFEGFGQYKSDHFDFTCVENVRCDCFQSYKIHSPWHDKSNTGWNQFTAHNSHPSCFIILMKNMTTGRLPSQSWTLRCLSWS